MNLHVYALKRSGNNVIRNWLTHGRLMAICGNVRPEYLVPGLDLFDERGLKRPLPGPLSRHALRLHGPRPFRWMSRLPIPHYLGVEDRFVPVNEVGAGATQHVDLLIEEPAGVTGIYFDRWLVDRQYRLEIGQKLGLPRPGNRPQKGGWAVAGVRLKACLKFKTPLGYLLVPRNLLALRVICGSAVLRNPPSYKQWPV